MRQKSAIVLAKRARARKSITSQCSMSYRSISYKIIPYK